MREKRQFERFDLQIETILNFQDGLFRNKRRTYVSRNISCSGAFLNTSNPLTVGTKLDLVILLSQDKFGTKRKDERVKIMTMGMVVRTNELGMAIEFDKLYKMSMTAI